MFRITFVIVFCTSLLACGAQDSGLEHRLHHLEQEVRSILMDNEELRKKVEKLERSYDQAWSCHRYQDWDLNDVIEFDGCDVSTVAGDPSLGLVPIAEAGTYRLTFMGMVNLLSGEASDYGEVSLKVNYELVASANMGDISSDGGRGAHGSVAIDVLRDLQAGDIVSIESKFVNAHLMSDARALTHWTGQRLPSAARA